MALNSSLLALKTGAGLALVAVATVAAAQSSQSGNGAAGTQQPPAAIYKCESEGGPPTYQNSPGKNCRKLELQPLTTFNAPVLPRGAHTKAGARAAADSARVDNATQRARDSDRRRIIEDELKREESKLEALRNEYKGGEPERLASERNYQLYLDRVAQLKEDIERSESSVASLKRELAAIKE